MFLVHGDCGGKGDGFLPGCLYLSSVGHGVFYSLHLSCLFSGKFQKAGSELMMTSPRGAGRSCFQLFQMQCSDNCFQWLSLNCVSFIKAFPASLTELLGCFLDVA